MRLIYDVVASQRSAHGIIMSLLRGTVLASAGREARESLVISMHPRALSAAITNIVRNTVRGALANSRDSANIPVHATVYATSQAISMLTMYCSPAAFA